MVQQIISGIANGVVPILVTALVAVLTVVVKGVGDAAVAYIGRKKDAIVAKIGADTYDHDLTVARSIWGAVDEWARVSGVKQTIEAKQAKFAELIVRSIPGITDDEIEQLRQAIAGEVNRGREALTGDKTDAPAASVAPTAFPGLDNVTVETINTAVGAANLAISNATSDEDKAKLTSALAALKTLQAAKAAEG